MRRQRLCQCSCASLDGACGCFLLACSYCRGGVRDGAVGVIRGGVFLSAVGIATVARDALTWRAKPYYNNGGWSAMLRSVGRPTPNFQEFNANQRVWGGWRFTPCRVESYLRFNAKPLQTGTWPISPGPHCLWNGSPEAVSC